MTRFACAALALLLYGCLPGDTRPPPGSVFLTAEPSAAVQAGVATADGWQISFERLLVGIGDARLGNDACTSYANAGYERLFDLVAAQGPQKISEVFALGACGLQLRLRYPGVDALRGQGVSAQDLAFMRVPDSDAYVTGRGTSVFVRGQAARGAEVKRFAWAFRQGYTLHDCPVAGAGVDAGLVTDITLHGNDARRIAVVIHGEELFRERASDDAPLRFDAIAGADTDGDQDITLDELAKVPGPPPEADAGLTSGSDGGMLTLADLLYLTLVPRMVRVGGSDACLSELRGRPR